MTPDALEDLRLVVLCTLLALAGMADDVRHRRGCRDCSDVDDVQRAANARAEEARPEWIDDDNWQSHPHLARSSERPGEQT